MRTPEQRALPLLDLLYANVGDPPACTAFLEALSNELGGPAIAMSLTFPGWNDPPEIFAVGYSDEYQQVFLRHFAAGLPWGPLTDSDFREGFAHANRKLPDERVRETDYYTEYMEPQGLAPEGPIAHLIAAADGRPVSGISIQRKVGGRHFDASDLDLCNLLVPHLHRAHAIRRQLESSRRGHGARTEVLDRIPTGILLIDAARRAVVTNRSAQRILDAKDGLYERDGILHASRDRDERALQDAIDAAVHADSTGHISGGFLGIRRPSGAPAYALSVTGVFAPPTVSAVGDHVAAIFIRDPSSGQAGHVELFQHLYGLSKAEAELVSHLAQGRSLEEISKLRGVTLNTTRTQLRRVFTKTKTNRQAEIVRLALTGTAPVGEQ